MLFWAADLVVLPYKRIYQSGVLLTALSYGKAVIASDLPPFTEILEDGSNGLLFEANNAESLAAVLTKALGNEKKLELLEERAFSWVTNSATWTDIAKKSHSAYCSVLDNR